MRTVSSPERPASASRRRHIEPADALFPRWLNTLLVALLLLCVLVPVLYLVLLSLSSDNDIALGAVSLARVTIVNYAHMWTAVPLASSIMHSIIIAGCAALLSVLLALLAAYPLARIRFRGRAAFLQSLVWAQTVPHTTLVLPLFVILAGIQGILSVHLIGGYLPVIVTYMTFGLPLSTWTLFSYMRRIPAEVEEAALIDGCSRARLIWQIVLPMALPASVVAFVFTFLVGWNDVLFASVLTNTDTATLGIVLQRLADVQTGLPVYGQLMAASVVGAIPAVVLYIGLQRFLVQGLSSGSVTGV